MHGVHPVSIGAGKRSDSSRQRPVSGPHSVVNDQEEAPQGCRDDSISTSFREYEDDTPHVLLLKVVGTGQGRCKLE